MKKGKGSSQNKNKRNKRWHKLCCQRNQKMQTINNLPVPPPMLCPTKPIVETWEGYRKTKTSPSIYYREASKEEEEQKTTADFNADWRTQFTTACESAKAGRQPITVRFKPIPAFEGKYKSRIEPTARAGYEVRKRNNEGELLDSPLLHIRFYYYEHEARQLNITPPMFKNSRSLVDPNPCWRTCPRVRSDHATLHKRFRVPGAGRRLKEEYERDRGNQLVLKRSDTMDMEV